MRPDKNGFAFGETSKTVALFSDDGSTAFKLTEGESEQFILLINDAELEKIDYDEADDALYCDVKCVFLNIDAITYTVLQHAADGSIFCVKTHIDESEDGKTSSAYKFQSEELAKFIAEHKETAELPYASFGSISNVKKDNADILLLLPDGSNIDLQGEWIFKKIISQGSNDPASKSMDFDAISTCFGEAVMFSPDGTGIYTHSYISESPVYESITWKYLVSGGEKIGLIYGNSGFSFLMKIVGEENGNPVFEMKDAFGSDEKYGDEFVRVAELERMDKESDIEHETGIQILDIHSIEVLCGGMTGQIKDTDDVYTIVSALHELELTPASEAFAISENNYEFALTGHYGKLIKIKSDDSGQWLIAEGVCYVIDNPQTYEKAKQIIESYIDACSNSELPNTDELMHNLMRGNLVGAELWWTYYPTESYRLKHWSDEDFSDNWGEMNKNLDEDDKYSILYALVHSEFETMGSQAVENTGLYIKFQYEDGSEIRLTADNEDLYMSLWHEGSWYYSKVKNVDLFEHALELTGQRGLDTDILSGTQAITIYYVKEEDRKTYPENSRLSEINITDNETVEKIAKAAAYESGKTLAYPSREYSDIVFHTPGGDYYAKIKFPVTSDENGISEPTFIVNGYFYFTSEELYKLLIEAEKLIG